MQKTKCSHPSRLLSTKLLLQGCTGACHSRGAFNIVVDCAYTFRSMSAAVDIAQWHGASIAQLRSQEEQVPALPPMFDQCTHAILTAISFVTSSAVMVASSAAAAAARAASVPQRRVFDEFDLDSPSPPRPRPALQSSRNAQQSRQDHEPFQLDAISPSSLVLHRSQQVLRRLHVSRASCTSLHAARLIQLLACLLSSKFVSLGSAATASAVLLYKVPKPLCPAQPVFTI